MKILSIQIGMPIEVQYRGQPVKTGIFKSPVKGHVMLRTLGLDGDGQADLKVHGGRDKALYGFSFDAYPWWEKNRPQDKYEYGAFGENIVFDRLPEDQIFVDDQFSLGTAIVQATMPRMPCYKLGIKFQDQKILKVFMQSERPGVYFRVLHEGIIQAGDELKLINHAPNTPSIFQLFVRKKS